MDDMDKNRTEPDSHSQPGVLRACYSDRGRVRQRNEDACALPSPGVNEPRLGTLLALADGTGGLPGGGEASQAAVHHLQAVYYAETGAEHPADRLRESVEAVNVLNRLAQRRQGIERGYLTTLVAAIVHQDRLWIANVGDSRAYLIQAETRSRVQLTEDHSNHNRLVKAGIIEEDDPSQRGVITRAIGLEDDCQVDIYRYEWQCGDRLVLCSDGLSKLPAEDMIAYVFDREPAGAVRDLVARAVEIDGSDNCTAVIAGWECLPHDRTEEPVETKVERGATVPFRPKPSDDSVEGTQEPPVSSLNNPDTVHATSGSPAEAPLSTARTEIAVRQLPAEIQPEDGTRGRFPIATLLLGVLLGWLTAALVILWILST